MRLTISWSGGKDSALALYRILLEGRHSVAGLHTVINKESHRVGLHGIPEEMVDEQARSIDLPLTKLYLKGRNRHADYVSLLQAYYHQCKMSGIEGVVFGDIFLEDLKNFRQALLEPFGLIPMFPLWKKDPELILDNFLAAGFKSLLCSANAAYFGEHQMGKTLDINFMNSLPQQVDPCGENGEFHTFVYDGPLFSYPVAFEPGQVVRHSYNYKITNNKGLVQDMESSFWFQELFPRIAL
jgi:uncharacterized protein (TIGR00290 family)